MTKYYSYQRLDEEITNGKQLLRMLHKVHKLKESYE